MVIIVSFDNSTLSKTALHRVEEFKKPTEAIHAVTVIPKDNREYARDRGWLGEEEEFELERIVDRLSEIVRGIVQTAQFDYLVVDRYASTGQIGIRLRKYAREHDARLVIIGSENAGRITTNLGSIGSTVAADMAFDIMIIRHPMSMATPNNPNF